MKVYSVLSVQNVQNYSVGSWCGIPHHFLREKIETTSDLMIGGEVLPQIDFTPKRAKRKKDALVTIPG